MLLVFIGQHHGKHPFGLVRISWVWRSKLFLLVVIVHLEEDLMTFVLERSEVVLFVGIIIGCEGVKCADHIEYIGYDLFTKGLDTSGHHNGTALEGLAEAVVQFSDLLVIW